MKTFINPDRSQWKEIIQRPLISPDEIKGVVTNIIEEVKSKGDNALKKFSLEFDKVKIDELQVSEEEVMNSGDRVDTELKNAIGIAKNNIEKFHRSQEELINEMEIIPGVVCWRKPVAIEKVGLYIPGGSAPLFSTLLMLGIPAVIAGCKEIVVCTPPAADGSVNPVILYTAGLLGIKKIYKTGGAQAVAAMAFGTETIPRVNKIFGPGNQYVTMAKQLISIRGTAIDMPAGPSEVAIYADESCRPEFVAADLLSQAEHGADSQVLLVATSEQIVECVRDQVLLQSEELSRNPVVLKSLEKSCMVVLDTPGAFELLNEYAPEHLIIASDDAEQLSQNVVNAGSVFLGHYSPESAGDYASGTNHTLPTNGNAKAYSGVSLDSFVKKITFQRLTREGLQDIGNAIEVMANAEGLDAHAKAVSIRLKK